MLNFKEDGQAFLFDLDSWFGKTSQAPSQAERRRERTSGSSLKRSRELVGIPYLFIDLTPGHGDLLGEPYWELRSPWHGAVLMHNTGVSPRDAAASFLSRILEAIVPLKYYLTARACLGILRRAKERGKKLPDRLERALMIQAGLVEPDGAQTAPLAFAANQRDEVRDLHDVAGALGAQPGMKQQTFVASGFCAGASPTAGGIGYQKECSPTLKAGDSGTSMVPSILCLNDQGGAVMACSEDISGTLRAQEHGHQPVLFENHGIDGRYTGPSKICPTMTARYGTGGNNTPLIGQSETCCAYTLPATDHHAVFSRQRVDVFKDNDVVCTQSARQHKDATDLVLNVTGGALQAGSSGTFPHSDDSLRRPMLLRRLIPLECERLQGFPDGWTDIPGASDSARYKALGNSVAIPCVEFIAAGLAGELRKE